MKKWKIRLSYPSGETRETWIEAETETEAGQKFFRRKDGAKMLGEGKVEVEITENIDVPAKHHYTREILIGLCEDGIRDQHHWYDRDSESATRQLGEAWSLLKAGCDFKVKEAREKTVRIEVFNIEGFQYHELGLEGLNSDHFYIPTRARLEAVGDGDWYC